MRAPPADSDIVTTTRRYEAWIARQVSPVAEGLAFKHAQMATTPFRFLRGGFYRWAQNWPVVCPSLATAPQVLAVGDLHIDNFSTWRDGDGRLVWGINDFSEAFPMPYANDLVRLATSALPAAPENAGDQARQGLRGDPRRLLRRHRQWRWPFHPGAGASLAASACDRRVARSAGTRRRTSISAATRPARSHEILRTARATGCSRRRPRWEKRRSPTGRHGSAASSHGEQALPPCGRADQPDC